MKRIITLATLAMLLTTNTPAAIISGTHTLSDGRTVNLSGLEWLDWTTTMGQSRLTVEDDRLSAGGDLEGWRYATRLEFNTLFDSLWGGTTNGWSDDNAPGADWLATTMGDYYHGSDSRRNTGSFVLYGADGDCEPDPRATCFGQWNGPDPDKGDGLDDYLEDKGFFSAPFGLTTTGWLQTFVKTAPTTFSASAIVRDPAPVPLPAAVWLFGSAIAGFGFITRKRKGVVTT